MDLFLFFLLFNVQDSREMRSRTPLMTGRNSFTISSSKDSGSSETDEEVDLELRL